VAAALPVSELALLWALATFIDRVRTDAIPIISIVFMQVLPETTMEFLGYVGVGRTR
jgi:hypothetical protein